MQIPIRKQRAVNDHVLQDCTSAREPSQRVKHVEPGRSSVITSDQFVDSAGGMMRRVFMPIRQVITLRMYSETEETMLRG